MCLLSGLNICREVRHHEAVYICQLSKKNLSFRLDDNGHVQGGMVVDLSCRLEFTFST